MRSRLDGCLTAPNIGHQYRHNKVFKTPGTTHNNRGIRHLRQDRWRDKRADLDFPNARSVFGLYPGHLVRCRHDRLDALKPISRAYFADCDGIHDCFFSSAIDMNNHFAGIVSSHEAAKCFGCGGQPFMHFFIGDQVTRFGQRDKFLLECRALRLIVIHH